MALRSLSEISTISTTAFIMTAPSLTTGASAPGEILARGIAGRKAAGLSLARRPGPVLQRRNGLVREPKTARPRPLWRRAPPPPRWPRPAKPALLPATVQPSFRDSQPRYRKLRLLRRRVRGLRSQPPVVRRLQGHRLVGVDAPTNRLLTAVHAQLTPTPVRTGPRTQPRYRAVIGPLRARALRCMHRLIIQCQAGATRAPGAAAWQ